MTPKNRPLDGGIYKASHEGSTPPLPVKKSGSDEGSPRGMIVDAQKNREQQLSEKERGKMFDEEKQELWRKGLITQDEIYNIQCREVLNETLAARKRMSQGYSASGHPGHAGYSGYSGHAGYSTSSYPAPPAFSASGRAGYSAAKPGEGLDPQQLQQLLEAGVISEQDIINDKKAQKDFSNSTSSYPAPPAFSASGQAGYSAAKPGEGLDPQQLQQLLEAGVISEQDIINDKKAQKDFSKEKEVNLAFF